LDHKVEIPYLISSSKDLTVTRSPKSAVCDWVGVYIVFQTLKIWL